jgi:excinuclease ABC subunit A
VIVAEHDQSIIAAADHVIDLGPGAGKAGGQVVAATTPAVLVTHADSVTGQYLATAAGLTSVSTQANAR